jgi:hypothetical protein
MGTYREARRVRLPNGASVRTTAARRFLIVGQYRDARPAVETSTDRVERAVELVAQYRHDFPFTVWHLIDQEGQA